MNSKNHFVGCFSPFLLFSFSFLQSLAVPSAVHTSPHNHRTHILIFSRSAQTFGGSALPRHRAMSGGDTPITVPRTRAPLDAFMTPSPPNPLCGRFFSRVVINRLFSAAGSSMFCFGQRPTPTSGTASHLAQFMAYTLSLGPGLVSDSWPVQLAQSLSQCSF